MNQGCFGSGTAEEGTGDPGGVMSPEWTLEAWEEVMVVS